MNDLREGRFSSSIPIVTQEQFLRSHFLRLYDQTEQNPNNHQIINSLWILANRGINCAEIVYALNALPLEHNVITIYTSNVEIAGQKFYNYINKQLSDDNEEILRYLMPLIRRATFQINNRPWKQACYVYRGMKLNKNQRKFFEVGRIFRFPGFTSTSSSKQQAERFGDVLFQIYVYTGCLQVRNLIDISCCPEEQEYLFPPYSLFQVTNVTDKIICLNSIDNRSDITINHNTEEVFFCHTYSAICTIL